MIFLRIFMALLFGGPLLILYLIWDSWGDEDVLGIIILSWFFLLSLGPFIFVNLMVYQ